MRSAVCQGARPGTHLSCPDNAVLEPLALFARWLYQVSPVWNTSERGVELRQYPTPPIYPYTAETETHRSIYCY